MGVIDLYNDAPLSASTTDNWVARKGGLPPFVRAIARALMKRGYDESTAIAIAISRVKSAAKGRWQPGKAHPPTVAKGGAASARWEAMKASSHTRGGPVPVDLAILQAQRDKAKAAGLTFPGTTSYPLAGPDGKFSRALADKAVRMVQLGNVASAPAIRKWLMGKLRSNGAADLIPSGWKDDGTVDMSRTIGLAASPNMCVYDPQGDERASVMSNLRSISAIRKSGRSKQADGLMDSLVRSKSSRARKLPNGERRAHTPTEVRLGLDRMKGAS